MKLKPKNKLIEHFSELEDPQIERSKRHKLIDILTITLMAEKHRHQGANYLSFVTTLKGK